MTTTLTPAEVFPPGEYLRDELEERGWTVTEFAEIIGRPVQAVSEILNNKKEITTDGDRVRRGVRHHAVAVAEPADELPSVAAEPQQSSSRAISDCTQGTPPQPCPVGGGSKARLDCGLE